MLATLVFIGLATLHTPATFDANYVFTIPIRIENMTHITTANVSCSVTHMAIGLSNPIDLSTPGTGMASVPVRDGNFNGSITVTVVVSRDRLAAYTPTNWGCGIAYEFRNPDGTIYRESIEPGRREAIYTRLTGQAVTTATVEVTGTIPPG